MSLVTGSPIGNVLTQEDVYIEGSPVIYFQDYNATPLKNPDAQGFYWGMSGTSTYPVYEIGCVLDVSLTEGLTMNDVRCDTIGVVDTIQRRDYVEFQFTIQSLLPLSTLRHMMNLGTPVLSTNMEQVPIGGINNSQKYMVYAPKVYDESVGDYLLFHLHKAKFVDAWNLEFAYAEPWKLTGLKLRAYADNTKPSIQRFGVITRSDESAL